jgi:anti-sigma B factor antagonist
MELKSIQHNDVTVVSIMDDLDAATSEEATAYLSAEIEGGHTKLVIELGGVTYMSSAGLRVILAAVQKAQEAGGDVRLAGAAGNVRRVLDMAGFFRFIKTFPTAGEAVASYSR